MKKMLSSLMILAGLAFVGRAYGDAPSADAGKDKPAGVAVFVAGDVSVVPSAAEAKPKSLKLGGSLYAGDRIKTGSNGKAALMLTDGTQLKLNYNTDITLKKKDIEGEKNLRGINAVSLFIGNIWSKIAHNPKSTFDIETPAAVAAVKGSSGEVEVDEQKTSCIKWREGHVVVTNDQGTCDLKDTEEVCVEKGKPCPGPQKWTPPATGWFTQTQPGGQSADLTLHMKGEDGQDADVVVHYENTQPQALTKAAGTK